MAKKSQQEYKREVALMQDLFLRVQEHEKQVKYTTLGTSNKSNNELQPQQLQDDEEVATTTKEFVLREVPQEELDEDDEKQLLDIDKDMDDLVQVFNSLSQSSMEQHKVLQVATHEIANATTDVQSATVNVKKAAKVGAVTASLVGATIGLIILGPVGGIAGGILGGSLTLGVGLGVGAAAVGATVGAGSGLLASKVSNKVNGVDKK